MTRFKWKWGHNLAEPVGHSKGNLKREVYGHECHTRVVEWAQTNNLNMHLKLLDKWGQVHPKSNGQKQIMKSGQKSMNSRQKKNTTMNQLQKKVLLWNNKINKPLTKLTKRKKKTQTNKIRDEKRILQQTETKFRRSYGKTLETYTPANWKLKKKQINFLTHD
jgi:hypothetical protein